MRDSADRADEPPEAVRPAADLVPLVYDKLKDLARRYMQGERGYQTLQPTALVHEAYVRLARLGRVDWRGKTHFYATAATQMRRVLIDRARAVASQKRGSRAVRFTLHDNMAVSRDRALDLLAVDEALRHLAEKSPRQGRVAELRLFAGLLVDETAGVLGVSAKTVKRDWRMARAWLARELKPGPGGA